jgi:PSP1 C-terminal conserved region
MYRRIDFRDLVRDLFALYKTRIWMAQIDSSFEPNFDATMALMTGEYQQPNSSGGSSALTSSTRFDTTATSLPDPNFRTPSWSYKNNQGGF